MSAAVHTPMTAVSTRVYLGLRAGGFDLRNCPDAEKLAAFIASACNSHAALVAALETVIAWMDEPCTKESVNPLPAARAALKAAKGEA